jgi:hypothetical protein
MATATPTIRTHLVAWTGGDDYAPPVNAPFEMYHPSPYSRRPGWQFGDELAVYLTHLKCVRMLLEVLTPARWDKPEDRWYTQTRVIAVSDNGIPLADFGVARCIQGGVQGLSDAQRDALHADNGWSRWTDSSYDEWVAHAITLP